MLLIAHRAGTDRFPEQSLDAVSFSLENGADIAEVDLRFTLDPKVPVISHDENAFRVFGVNKNVGEMTLPEFLSLHYVENPTLKTYTLKTLLESTEGRILLHVKMTAGRFPSILSVIHECKAEKRVILGVLERDCVDVIKKDDETIEILSFMNTPDDFLPFLETPCDYIRLWEPWVTKERIDLIHEKGKKCWIMSGSEKTVGYTDWKNFEKWKNMGADGVLINEVLKARQYL